MSQNLACKMRGTGAAPTGQCNHSVCSHGNGMKLRSVYSTGMRPRKQGVVIIWGSSNLKLAVRMRI